jgi:dimethylamine corrinoid protein
MAEARGGALIREIVDSILSVQGEKTLDLVGQALREGIDPITIVNDGLTFGLRQLGERYEKGEAYIPHLMIAGDAVGKAMKILEPHLPREESGQDRPLVLIGTVKDDIHDLGKNLVATMLSVSGFKVVDLGKNVDAETFVQKVKELKPRLLCLSALMTTTMLNQRKVIEALKEAQEREGLRIMVGGAPASEEWANQIEADAYAEDAMEAVRTAKALVAV